MAPATKLNFIAMRNFIKVNLIIKNLFGNL